MFDNLPTPLRGLMAALMVLSVVIGGAGFAAASDVTGIDTETTSTPTTSDWTGTNVAAINVSDGNDQYVEVELAAAAEGDVVLEVTEPTSNETVLETSYDTVTNSSANHYAFNITDREMEQLPIAPNETKTFDVRVYDAGNDSSAELTFQQDFSNEPDRARILVGDYAVNTNDAVDFEEKGIPFLTERTVASGEETVSFPSGETNRTVTLELANTTTADSFENAASSEDSGTWIEMTMASVEDEPVKVYKNSAPSDLGDNTSYAVYDVSSETLTFHIADDENDIVDVDYTGGDNFSPWDVRGLSAFSWGDIVSLSVPF